MDAYAITGQIGLDEAPAVKALKDTAQASIAMKDTVEHSGKQAGEGLEKGIGGALGHLKGLLGRRSVLGESLELLAGGGVIFAAGAAASQFNELTGKVEGLSDGFDALTRAHKGGEVSFGEWLGKAIKSIPVAGEVFEGTQRLKGAITGETAALNAQNAALEASQRHWAILTAAQERFIAASRAARAGFQDVMQSSRDQVALMNTQGGNRDVLQLELDTRDKKKALQDSLDAERSQIDVLGSYRNTLVSQGKTGSPEYNDAEAALQAAKTRFNKDVGQLSDALHSVDAAAYAARADLVRKSINQKGFEDEAKPIADAIFKELPNPGVAAREMFGAHTVTSADVPPPVEKIESNTASSAATLKDLVPAVKDVTKAVNSIFTPMTFSIPG